MRIFFFLILLSLTLPQTPSVPQESSGLEVLTLDVKEKAAKKYPHDPGMVSNKPPEIHPTLGRGDGDRNDPPNVVSLEETRKDRDQRMRDMDALANKKPEFGSRSDLKPVYESRAQMKNNSSRSIVSFVWAYKASPALQYTHDQEFFCNVRISPGTTKLLKIISRYPQQNLLNASAPSPEIPSLKDVIINYVKFGDGTTWRRPDWRSDWNSRIRLERAERFVKGKCFAP